MKKFTNKDYINILILVLIFLLILFSTIRFTYVNGSEVDWISQHTIFPEYFRTLFYDTKDLFPSFAFNIGAGTNIYNLSYYGLLSPIVLLSYLFPFIKMVNFILVSMVIVVIISIIIMYYFLRCKFNSKYTFFGTLLFLLSGPLIFHTHRHIMFINYMPFLILSLIGVDKYFDNNKKTLLIISVFLIIMSSYYYSVGSIICILLYYVYRYIEINKKMKLSLFIKDSIKFVFLIIVGIMMSGVLLLPSFYAILNGRPEITSLVNIKELLIPKLNISEVLYHSYSIGVTSIFIISLVYSFFTKNKNYKFLSIIFILILLFPIIIYLLSGMMYVRGKVLIPFLPLAILMITLFVDKVSIKDNKYFNITIFIVSIIQIFVHISDKYYVFILDVLIVLICLFMFFKKRDKRYIMYPVCLCAFVCCLVNNYSDELVTKKDLTLQYNTYNYNILNKLLESDNSIYRVGNDIMGIKNINRVINSNYYLPSIYSSLENQNYYNFYNNMIGSEMQNNISTAIMSSKNILFNTYMSTKYMITDDGAPIGYKNMDNSNVYVNDNVLPIGYATRSVMSKDVFDTLDEFEKAYALVTNVIVDQNISENYDKKVVTEDIKYEKEYKNLILDYKEDKYIIQSENNGNIVLSLNKSYKDKLLFITFDMEYSESCNVGDTSVIINGVKNTLSCAEWTYHNNNYKFSYVISSNDEINKLDIKFSKGKYVISNIEVHSLDYNYITDYVDEVDEFIIDKGKTLGDEIVGTINVSENGYFVLSIPYEEKGFMIYVDDKLTTYEKINDTFIGFKINEGYHNIKIIYKSPYLLEGMIISICGYMMFLPIIYNDIFKKKRVMK